MKFNKQIKKIDQNKDAGNVELNTAIFNHVSSVSDSPSTNIDGPMGESVDNKSVKKENSMKEDIVELFYKNLEVPDFTIGSYDPYYDTNLGGWLPSEDKRVDIEIEWTYKADRSMVKEFLSDIISDTEFDPEELENLDDPDKYGEFIDKYIEDNFDALVDKYEPELLDHFHDFAVEDARENYDYDDLNESCKKDEDPEINESIKILKQDCDDVDDDYNDFSAFHLDRFHNPLYDGCLDCCEICGSELCYDENGNKFCPICSEKDQNDSFPLEENHTDIDLVTLVESLCNEIINCANTQSITVEVHCCDVRYTVSGKPFIKFELDINNSCFKCTLIQLEVDKVKLNIDDCNLVAQSINEIAEFIINKYKKCEDV